VSVALAGICAESVVLGYKGSGSESDVHDATSIILHQLDAGDSDFGPSLSAMEYAGRDKPTGSQDMRANAWHLVRPRYDASFQRTVGLVAEHGDRIERLARVLLDADATLSGGEIVAVITASASAADR
jgi:hypothetical protein